METNAALNSSSGQMKDIEDMKKEVVTATVFIPTFNGEKHIDEVLTTVFNQKTDFNFEVIIIDSGSTDKTLRIIKKYSVKLIEIPNEEFNHGNTRNLGVSKSQGEFVAFLTQDSTPVNEHWLQELVDSFKLDDSIACVFGKHIPRLDCNPATKRDIIEHFRNISPDDKPLIQYVDDVNVQLNEGPLVFFSNVNSCIKKNIWRKIPFRVIDYSEDQIFARDVLMAGYKKVYNPNASTFHSHSYPILIMLKRFFDEYKGLKIALGYVDRVNVFTIIPSTLHGLWFDSKYIWKQDEYTFFLKIYWSWYAFWLNLLKRTAAILGGRYEKLPNWLIKRISLEISAKIKYEKSRKIRFTSDDKTKYLIRSFFFALKHEGVREAICSTIDNYSSMKLANNIKSNGDYYNFIYLADTSKKYPSANFTKKKDLLLNEKRKLKINWIIPDFGIGSGGHMDIFRVIHHLEKFGHINNIYIFGQSRHGSVKNAKKIINKHFLPLKANLYLGLENFEDCDVGFATSWQTAYPLYSYENVLLRCYFVQDFEPFFYPVSSEYIFAENTYRFGYTCITLGPWLAKVLKQKYDIDAYYFDMPYDAKEYFPEPDIKREDKSIAFYARYVTPRRAFELGILALRLVLKKHPDTKVILYGWDTGSLNIPFNHVNMGILDHSRLRELYNRATIGLVFSLTNSSLAPYEMMACKLPVIDVKNDSTLIFYKENPEIITLSEPDPYSIANSIIDLLENKEKRETIAEKAYEHVKQLSWEKSSKRIEEILYKELEKI